LFQHNAFTWRLFLLPLQTCAQRNPENVYQIFIEPRVTASSFKANDALSWRQSLVCGEIAAPQAGQNI
jgi:hypothetical protein